MKKNYNLIVMITFCSVVCFFIGSASGEQNVTQKGLPAITCAAMEFTGSYQQMEKNFGVFMQEFFKQGLQPAGPPMSIYFNSPKEVSEEKLRWAIAFPFNGKTAVAPPLKKVEIPACQAVSAIHMGPYQNLERTHTRMMNYVRRNKLKLAWPLFEKYLNNPQQVKPEELKTEIFYPIKK